MFRFSKYCLIFKTKVECKKNRLNGPGYLLIFSAILWKITECVQQTVLNCGHSRTKITQLQSLVETIIFPETVNLWN